MCYARQPPMKPDTVSAPGHPPPRRGEGLARYAGVTGVATLASRLLGLARDQVLAAFFGASNEMDAFVVAFRVPNLVRDLFAEGAMSAAFVPTFTRQLTLKGKADAWRLANNVLNALLLSTGALVVLGIAFARPLVEMYAGDFASVAGQARADGSPDARDAAVSDDGGGGGGSDGHAELTASLLRPRAVAGDVQHRDDRRRVRPRPADAAARAAADHGDRVCRAGRRTRTDRDPVAVAQTRRLPLSARLRPARSRSSPGADPDGARARSGSRRRR